MPCSGLDHLPSEIIIQVFKSIDNFHTIVSLVCTSRTFHAIWQRDTSSICNAVLPMTIDCFADAKELAITQELVLEPQQHFRPGESCQAASALKRFRSNARTASLVCDVFQAHFRYCENTRTKLSLTTLTPSERIRMVHAFYRVWTITILVQQGSVFSQRLDSILATLSAREIFRIQEIALWLATQCPRGNLQELSNAAFGKEPGRNELPGVYGSWAQGFEAIHEEFSRERFAPYSWPLPQCTLGTFAVFDEWQGELEVLPETA